MFIYLDDEKYVFPNCSYQTRTGCMGEHGTKETIRISITNRQHLSWDLLRKKVIQFFKLIYLFFIKNSIILFDSELLSLRLERQNAEESKIKLIVVGQTLLYVHTLLYTAHSWCFI